MSDYQKFLEDEALRLGLAGQHPILADLRSQVGKIDSRERDFTGVGFFTKLTLGESIAPAAFEGTVGIHGISGTSTEMPGRFSIILWASEGRLSTIEGMADEGNWALSSNPELDVALNIRAAMALPMNFPQ